MMPPNLRWSKYRNYGLSLWIKRHQSPLPSPLEQTQHAEAGSQTRNAATKTEIGT